VILVPLYALITELILASQFLLIYFVYICAVACCECAADHLVKRSVHWIRSQAH